MTRRRPWTENERERLVQCAQAGMTTAEAAAQLDRTVGAVKQQRINYGLPRFARSKIEVKRSEAAGTHYRSGKPLYNFKDLTGQSFGFWRVEGLSSKRSPEGRPLWRCRCACGTKKLVKTEKLTLARENNGACRRCGRAKSQKAKDAFIQRVLANAMHARSRVQARHAFQPRAERTGDSPRRGDRTPRTVPA